MDKVKILVLLWVSILSVSSVDAQLNKWLNKQKKKIQKNEYVKKAQKSLNKIDPKTYLVRKINENYYLQGYINKINAQQRILKNSIKNNISLYNNLNADFKLGFNEIENFNENLNLLSNDSKKLRLPVKLSLNHINYDLYRNGESIIAVSKNKMPVNDDLEKVIKAGYWANNSKRLNSSYISNVSHLANLNVEFYGYLLLFNDFCVKGLSKFGDLKYGNLTAVSLIDTYFKNIGSNLTTTKILTTFRSNRNHLKEIQDLSKRIHQNSRNYLKTKEELSRSNRISYSKVETSINGFKSIANDINNLANRIADQREDILNQRKELIRLSDFYGISFFETIGDLYKYLDNYYRLIEESTRKHAFNFNEYINSTNQESSKLYQISKKQFLQKSKEKIDNELTHLEAYILLNDNLISNGFKNVHEDEYLSYLSKIKDLKVTLYQLKEEDFIKFNNALLELKSFYERFPFDEAKNYYESVLKSIDEKQIIGGDFFNSYFKEYTSQISLISSDKSAIYGLVKSGNNLNKYFRQAKQANVMFYVIVALICMILVLTMFFIKKKNKNRESPITLVKNQ